MQSDWLESVLASWAAWCETGTVAKQQVVSWLRERRGVYRSGASFEMQADSLEYAIEKAVSELHAIEPQAARVLRFEYSSRAGANQGQRAERLELSLRTYQRNLKRAKTYVYDAINKKRV